MALDSTIRLRTPFAPALDLPPPFRAVALREVGDAFAHAIATAAEAGAGTLVQVGRFDLAEFALVLEPDEPLRTARRAFYAGMVALVDALAAHAPPQKPIDILWPASIRIDGGLVGGGRLAWPQHADEDAPPAWLVFGAAIRTAAAGATEAGLLPQTATLEDEGFALASERLVESFARHFMTAVDRWQQDGFAEIADNYLARMAAESGVECEIAANGDLLRRRRGKKARERRRLVDALAQPAWLDATTGEPYPVSA